MADRPLISVLTTVYNREKHLRTAIESVLVQSCSEWELILVDDGSSDASVAVAGEYTGDPRITVHVNEYNLGDYPNRNRAASLARGKYLKYLDADDFMAPTALENFILQMESSPEAGLGLLKDDRYPWVPPVYLSSLDAYRMHYLGHGLLGRSPAAAVIRAEAFHSVGGFSGERYVGDTELWLRLAARFPVIQLSPGTVFWRSHGEQESSRETTFQALRQWQVQWEALARPECPLQGRELAQAKRNVSRWLWLRFGGLLRLGKFGEAVRVLAGGGLGLHDLLGGLWGYALPYSLVGEPVRSLMNLPLEWSAYPGATGLPAGSPLGCDKRPSGLSPWSGAADARLVSKSAGGD